MRNYFTAITTFIVFALFSRDIVAGGPLGAVGTTPRKYAASSFPIRYMIDQGPLGAFSNATATVIANYAFAQWAGVSTAAVSFSNAGMLSRDVTSASDPLISGSTQYSDGINPVVFDNNGSITDAKLGLGASRSILGFAGSAYYTNTYVEGYVIINGALSGTGTQADIDKYEATITHEIGHFLGLGHTQVAFGAKFATMYPIVETNNQKVLSSDDQSAISLLYPSFSYLGSVGSITGTMKRPSGTILSGINVVAMNTTTGAQYTSVVDYFSGGKSGFDSPPAATGTYTISGLPSGSYYVHIEPINAYFTGGSSVASYNTPINMTVAREWYNGANESGNMLADNTNEHTAISVSAGSATSGINIISNESTTTSSLAYDNGTPTYGWSIPQSGISSYAVRFTSPSRGTLVGVKFTLDASSVLPSGGTLTVKVHQNAAGSIAGVPGTVLGSVTIPYSELLADQVNEIWLKGIGSSVIFDSLAKFHISVSTNGVGSPVIYSDNGTATQNRSSYFASGVWRNFPDGGWAAGYNFLISAVYSNGTGPTVVAVPLLAVKPSSVNFGTVRARSSRDTIIRITDSGTADLRVNGTALLGRDSLDFAIVSGGGPFTLTPGQFRDVTLRFQPCAIGGTEGNTRSAMLSIVSDAKTSPNTVPLTGTVIDAAPLAAVQRINFGRVTPGKRYTIDTTILYNAGTDTVNISRMRWMAVKNDSTFQFATELLPVGLPPDSSIKVRLIYAPNLPATHTTSLRIEHNGFPQFTDIEVFGLATGALAQLPAPVQFGMRTSIRIDTTVMIHNSGTTNLVIRTITIASERDSIPGDYFSVNTMLPLVVAAGDSVSLPVSFMPIGDKAATYRGSIYTASNSYTDSLGTIYLYASTSGSSSVSQNDEKDDFTLTPNPATGAEILIRTSRSKAALVELIDVLGRTIAAQPIIDGKLLLDIARFPSGNYLVRVSGDQWTQTKTLHITK